MSWIFVADDGEQVHYDVPPQVAELEAKLERQTKALEAIGGMLYRTHSLSDAIRVANTALEGEQDE